MEYEEAPRARVAVSLLGRIFFSFVGPLIRVARAKGAFQTEDIPVLDESLETSSLFERFDRTHRRRAAIHVGAGYAWSLASDRLPRIIFTALLYFVSHSLELVGPLLLQRLVRGLTCARDAEAAEAAGAAPPQCETRRVLYIYAISLCIAPILRALVSNNNVFLLDNLGLHFRNSLMAALFRKCLRMSNVQLAQHSTGKIMTLMSNDATKFQEFIADIHTQWGHPTYIIGIVVILYFELKEAVFVGLGVMVALVPVVFYVSRRLKSLRRIMVRFTDRRVGSVSEAINGVRVVKFYAWEDAFRQRINGVREQEADVMRALAVLEGFFALALYAGPVVAAALSLATFILRGNVLTSATLYTSLALFQKMRFPMAFQPQVVLKAVNAMVAMGRIKGFLDAEDMDSGSAAHWHHSQNVSPGYVSIRTGDFTWSSDGNRPSCHAKKGCGTSKCQASKSKVAGHGKKCSKGAGGGSNGCSKGAAAGCGNEKKCSKDAGGGSNGCSKAASGCGNENKCSNGAARVSNGCSKGAAGCGTEKQCSKAAAECGIGHKCSNGAPRPKRFENMDPLDELMDDGAREELLGSKTMKDEGNALALRGVNFECQPGTLTMVVGAVGSGKSSLLAAIMQQMECKSGHVYVGGKLGYVPQKAWIINETVRQNIVLGEPFDQDRYHEAVASAQLLTDLELLPDGDMTELGERGVTLSGGQKQRLSIARAVYQACDVVLLDDPLSALDAHVGRKLFEQCICGALRGRTVVLVTHALHFLRAADQILWVVDGEIRRAGQFDAMMEHLDFRLLVEKTSTQEDVEGGKREEGVDAVVQVNTVEAQGVVKSGEGKGGKALTGREATQTGMIASRVISAFVSAMGGSCFVLLLMVLFTLEQVTKIAADTWLGLFTREPPLFDRPLMFWIYIHILLALGLGAFTMIRQLNFMYGVVRAALGLHNDLLNKVLRLPTSFFDSNPSGRILNRFSRDTEIMDVLLPQALSLLIVQAFNFVGIIVVVTVATPIFAAFFPPIVIVYLLVQRYYVPMAREMQRLEATTRGPIYSRFSEAIDGIASIRAYRLEHRFVQRADDQVTTNAQVFVLQKAGNAWLAIRLDAMACLLLSAAAVLAVWTDIDPALAGLSISYALTVTLVLRSGLQVFSQVESQFNSIERIVEYKSEPEEAEEYLQTDPEPRAWPRSGNIDVQQVCMRYRKELPLVLDGVSFSVDNNEQIGIVGRTGSGKSSLFLAFFRMVELERGSIIVDGRDTRSMGLRTLRKGMALIPQDPFMFAGSVRKNLDPFDEYDDMRLMQALDNASLGDVVRGLHKGLESVVADSGENFSSGEKQLFCLARAMLREPKILMMDEATAMVDPETDQKIQLAIRACFEHSTVLTIAHRLHTIMDADRVLVMDRGNVGEFDVPDNLLQDPHSLFKSLVDSTGAEAAAYLYRIAADSIAVAAPHRGRRRSSRGSSSGVRPRGRAGARARVERFKTTIGSLSTLNGSGSPQNRALYQPELAASPRWRVSDGTEDHSPQQLLDDPFMHWGGGRMNMRRWASQLGSRMFTESSVVSSEVIE